MSGPLKGTLVVENVGGAGGTIGAGKSPRAQGDGYTLLFHHIGMSTAPALYRKLDFKPLDDFIPIGAVVDVPMTLIAAADHRRTSRTRSPASAPTRKKSIWPTLASARRRTLRPAVPERAEDRSDHGSVLGTGPAMTALLGGNVDVMCDQTTNTTGPDQGGRVKAFAVTSKGKLANFLELLPPLATELPGFEVGVWHILYAPKNTPADVGKPWRRRAIKDPAFLAKMNDLAPKSCPPDRQISPLAPKRC